MVYPPILHGAALLGSFFHTRPKSYWVEHCACCFKGEEQEGAIPDGAGHAQGADIEMVAVDSQQQAGQEESALTSSSVAQV